MVVNRVLSELSADLGNYLPTDIALEEGGYEVGACVFAPGSAELVIRASLDAISEVSS
ncbi:MAG: hypothetical protein QF745_09275 [Planctomycetota bacterium]|nr:hypothetical protein [Planctomycetota bacterium]